MKSMGSICCQGKPIHLHSTTHTQKRKPTLITLHHSLLWWRNHLTSTNVHSPWRDPTSSCPFPTSILTIFEEKNTHTRRHKINTYNQQFDWSKFNSGLLFRVTLGWRFSCLGVWKREGERGGGGRGRGEWLSWYFAIIRYNASTMTVEWTSIDLRKARQPGLI